MAPDRRALAPFQRLMRRWAELHPFNAIDVADVEGPLDVPRAAASAGIPLSVEREGPGEAPLAALERIAVRELNAPFPSSPASPFRLFVLPSGGLQRVGLVWDHWAADGFASARWFHDVAARGAAAPLSSSSGREGERGGRAFAAPGAWTGLAGKVAGSVADLLRMRRVYAPSSGDRDDLRVEARHLPLPPEAVPRLLATAHRLGVTLHDLLLAALAQAIGEAAPHRLDRRRREIAIGSVIDTRPFRPAHGESPFALDYFPVFVTPGEDGELDGLSRRVARQTRRRKSPGRVGQGELEALAANALWPLLRPRSRAAFLRRNYVLSAGISNQKLPEPWPAGGAARIVGHRRFAPAGPICPIAFALVTAGASVALTVTWQKTGYPSAEREAILEGFLSRLG